MNIKNLVGEFVAVFAVALVAVLIVIFSGTNRARRKYRRLGNLIQFCYHVRHSVDLDKVTGNQRKIEVSKI